MAKNFPEIVAQSDLLRRWKYSRQAIYWMMRFDPDFPENVATVNGTKTRIWLLDDIREYEKSHPWLMETRPKTRRYLHWKAEVEKRQRQKKKGTCTDAPEASRKAQDRRERDLEG